MKAADELPGFHCLQEAADQEREGSKKYEELVRQLTEEVDRGREESNATRREIAEVIQQKENELNEAMKCREVLQTENAQLRKQIEKLQEELKEVQLHSQVRNFLVFLMYNEDSFMSLLRCDAGKTDYSLVVGKLHEHSWKLQPIPLEVIL